MRRASRWLIEAAFDVALENPRRGGFPGHQVEHARDGILLALEDGFRLHRLIDPETTPADGFLRAIGDLQRWEACHAEKKF